MIEEVHTIDISMAFQMTAGFDVSRSGPFCAAWGVMCIWPFGITEPASAYLLIQPFMHIWVTSAAV